MDCSAQALGKRLSVEELHDQEFGTVLRADVVEMADLRMVERRNGPKPRVPCAASAPAKKQDATPGP
jgi:hypothetical protein